jgi:hypothetical protein
LTAQSELTYDISSSTYACGLDDYPYDPDAGAPSSKDAAHWYTPFGYAVGFYYNQASTPVKIESVKLIDPHNVVLRSVIVDEMADYQFPLPLYQVRSQFSHGLPWAQWNARAACTWRPAAPGQPWKESNRNNLNVYQIGVEMSAASPRGGWAAQPARKLTCE